MHQPFLHSPLLRRHTKSNSVGFDCTRVGRRPDSDRNGEKESPNVLSPAQINEAETPALDSITEPSKRLEQGILVVPAACTLQEPCPVAANFPHHLMMIPTDKQKVESSREGAQEEFNEQQLLHSGQSIAEKLVSIVEHCPYPEQGHTDPRDEHPATPATRFSIFRTGKSEIEQHKEATQRLIKADYSSHGPAVARSQRHKVLSHSTTHDDRKEHHDSLYHDLVQAIDGRKRISRSHTSRMMPAQRSISEDRSHVIQQTPMSRLKKRRTWSLQNLYSSNRGSYDDIELDNLSELGTDCGAKHEIEAGPSAPQEIPEDKTETNSIPPAPRNDGLRSPTLSSMGTTPESAVSTIKLNPSVRSGSWFRHSWFRALTAKSDLQVERSPETPMGTDGYLKDATPDASFHLEQGPNAHNAPDHDNKAMHDEASLPPTNTSCTQPDTDGPQTWADRKVASQAGFFPPASTDSPSVASPQSQSSTGSGSVDMPDRQPSRELPGFSKHFSASPGDIFDTPSSAMPQTTKAYRAMPSRSVHPLQGPSRLQSKIAHSGGASIDPRLETKEVPNVASVPRTEPKIEYTHRGYKGNGERVKRIQVIISFDGVDDLDIATTQSNPYA